jgi:rod shape-determining protein MreD
MKKNHVRILLIFLIAFVNFLLQTTWLQHIAIYNVRPDTATVLIVSVAITAGDYEGALVGFFCGLLQDIFYGQYLGFGALTGLLIGYFCGRPFKSFYRDNFFLPLLLVSASVFLSQFVYYMANFLLVGRTNVGFYMQMVILPVTAYSILFTIPIYHLIYKINKSFTVDESDKSKYFKKETI